jgi:predicted RNA-binding protein YlqC (UPF0109 family)
MSEIDQQFIEYVVKSLVGKPEAVHIDRRIDEKGVLLELTVDPEDLGRVIGKRGATAQSLRTLLRALGTKNDARYNLKIVDNGPTDRPDRPQRDDAGAKPADDKKAAASDDDTTTATVDDEPVPAPSEPATPKLGDEPESEPEAPEPAAEDEDAKTSDRLRQAREELSDLDDLDI